MELNWSWNWSCTTKHIPNMPSRTYASLCMLPIFATLANRPRILDILPNPWTPVSDMFSLYISILTMQLENEEGKQLRALRIVYRWSRSGRWQSIYAVHFRYDRTVTFLIRTHVSTEKAKRAAGPPYSPPRPLLGVFTVQAKLRELIFARSECRFCVVTKSSENS